MSLLDNAMSYSGHKFNLVTQKSRAALRETFGPRKKERSSRHLSCKICGAMFIPKVKKAGPEWRALRCPRCHVKSVDPWPTEHELENYYSNYPATIVDEKIGNQLISMHQPIADFLLSNLPNVEAPKFLDFGFGAGAFLHHLAQRKYSATGIEFSEQNIAQLQERANRKETQINTLHFKRGSLSELIQNQRYHCITLFQVIEHLGNPIETLRELSQSQKGGDLLYIECPNENSLFFKIKTLFRRFLKRTDFYGTLSPPQHLHGFNKRSLQELLEQLDYEIVKIGDYAFRDKVHQVETTIFYPTFTELMQKSDWYHPYHVTKFLIGLFDRWARLFFKAGGGLYVLGRKPLR